jgi:hypothetical protein
MSQSWFPAITCHQRRPEAIRKALPKSAGLTALLPATNTGLPIAMAKIEPKTGNPPGEQEIL